MKNSYVVGNIHIKFSFLSYSYYSETPKFCCSISFFAMDMEFCYMNNIFDKPLFENEEKCAKNSQKHLTTLRLRGGVSFIDCEKTSQLKSPFQECKSIMDKFDEILAAYKSSLGPCGTPTCPFSQNMIEDYCKSKCRTSKVVIEDTQGEDCKTDPCDVEECPYAERKRIFQPGCGSANCAYSRYKLGLVDEDASLEYMMLPPAISGKCGSPNCEYPLPPNLPPIHWDCPDPLPKGACKNPNCPHQPPDLKRITVPSKKKMCSCQDCPYAFPPPCGLPSCPFRENPCPFLNKHKDSDSACDRPSEENDVCSNPSCPFAPGPQGMIESNDSKFKGEFLACKNPNCPFVSKKDKRNNKNYTEKFNTNDEITCCGNPECPYAPYYTKINTTDNFNSGESLNCPNPDCPIQKKIEKGGERHRTIEGNYCGNPHCSYHNRSLTQNADNFEKVECDDNDIKCDYPDCPYSKNKGDNQSLCYYVDNEETERRKSGKGDYLSVDTKITVEKENNRRNGRKSNEKGGGNGNDNQVSKEPVDIAPKSKNKRKKGCKFVYNFGNMYPGVKIGHKECVSQVFNVPPKMGWLWNIPPPIVRLKPRRGWKPGALTRSMAAKIRAHRQAKGLGMLRVPKFAESPGEIQEEDFGKDVKVTPKPTLSIQKKDGAYEIIMNPLKDPKTLADNEDPYMECTPMRFKISPTKVKKIGSETCFCGEDEAENSSSTESELDIEFTPPAGIIHPERFKRKMNVIHCETQYNPQDFEIKKVGKKDDAKGKKDKKDKGGKVAKGKGGAKGKKAKK